MGTAANRLARGRKIRHRMSSELRSLSEGDIYIEDVLRDPSDALGRCRIYDILRRTPKLGDEGAKKLLVLFSIWPYDRLSEIPPEQRGILITALPERVLRKSDL